MRYIDAEKLKKKFESIGMAEAAELVDKAPSLKDPLGNNYGALVNSLHKAIDELWEENAQLEARLYELTSDTMHPTLEDVNKALRRDNDALRQAYKDLKATSEIIGKLHSGEYKLVNVREEQNNVSD